MHRYEHSKMGGVKLANQFAINCRQPWKVRDLFVSHVLGKILKKQNYLKTAWMSQKKDASVFGGIII